MKAKKADGAALQIIFGGKFPYVTREWKRHSDNEMVMEADLVPHPGARGFEQSMYPTQQNAMQIIRSVLKALPVFGINKSDEGVVIQYAQIFKETKLDENNQLSTQDVIGEYIDADDTLAVIANDKDARKKPYGYRLRLLVPEAIYEKHIAPHYPDENKPREEKPQRVTYDETFEDVNFRLNGAKSLDDDMVTPSVEMLRQVIEALKHIEWSPYVIQLKNQQQRLLTSLMGLSSSHMHCASIELANIENTQDKKAFFHVLMNLLDALNLIGYFQVKGRIEIANNKVSQNVFQVRDANAIDDIIAFSETTNHLSISLDIASATYEQYVKPVFTQLSNKTEDMDINALISDLTLPAPYSGQKSNTGAISVTWYDSDDESPHRDTPVISFGGSIEPLDKYGAWFYDQDAADNAKLAKQMAEEAKKQEEAERMANSQRAIKSMQGPKADKTQQMKKQLDSLIAKLNKGADFKGVKTAIMLLKSALKNNDKKQYLQQAIQNKELKIGWLENKASDIYKQLMDGMTASYNPS